MTFPDDAPCRGRTHLMYPTVTLGQHPNWQPALALCATCPHHDPCHDTWTALPLDLQDHGVWFGTTPDQRNRSYGRGRKRSMGLGRGRITIRCEACHATFTGGSRTRWCPNCRRFRTAASCDAAKAADAERHRKMRERRKAAGMCTQCGRHVARARKTTCVYCVERARARRQQRQGGAS